MKKWIALLLVAIFLTGCGAQETFETIQDEDVQSVMAMPRQVLIELPEEVTSPVMVGQTGEKLYFCDGYTLCLQTCSSGDLDATLQSVSGHTQDSLELQTMKGNGEKRYFAVWTASSEEGEQIGRLCIIDDGQFHYVASVMADAREAGKLQQTWANLLDSFRVVDTVDDVNSGS